MYICKIVEFNHKKKPLVTSLIFILDFQKNWIRFMISKIELKCFQIKLMLEMFMCLRLELLELLLKIYSLGVTFFFKFLILISWQVFYCLHFSLNFQYFFHFFPIRITKLRKFEINLTCWLGGGGVNPTI